MIFDGWLTQPGLPQPGLKAIQDRLVRALNRLDPLLIRLGIVGVRHGTLSFRSAVLLSLVSPSRQDRLAILEKNRCLITLP